ncbi:hypothetical protein FQN54_005889 [Arachnomyces sp. PD_36]|nr:hypothetical protein FQN54_005889 [Arachnomyces sp. PD_36]
MSNFAQPPEKYLSLLPAERCQTLTAINTKADKHRSQCSTYSTASSIPKFLEAKSAFLETQRDYLEQYQHEVKSYQRRSGILDPECQELDRILEAKYASVAEVRTLNKVREDIGDEIEDGLRDGLGMEDAYRAAVEGYLPGKKRLHPPKSQFRRNVFEFYDARNPGQESSPRAWCQLLGWCSEESVEAVHVVPKTLDEDLISYHVGCVVTPETDRKNSLCLHSRIKQALDDGDIVIVPVSGQDDEWKCIVTNGKILGNPIGTAGYRFDDIHKKQLQFRSASRPAKRYMFLRYLITYLPRRAEGGAEWARTVEEDIPAWAVPGKLLRRSSLRAFARVIGGEELAESVERIYGELTFPDET